MSVTGQIWVFETNMGIGTTRIAYKKGLDCNGVWVFYYIRIGTTRIAYKKGLDCNGVWVFYYK